MFLLCSCYASKNVALMLCLTYNIGSFKQDDTLEGVLASVDVSTEDNMKNLVKVGEKLLKNKVTRVNIHTGIRELVPDKDTVEEELKRFILFYNLLFIILY